MQNERRQITRRQAMLRCGAAALFVPLSGTRFHDSTWAAEKPTDAEGEITFGFSLYGMRSLKTTDALRTVARIGYDAVEVVANEGWPCDPGTVNASEREVIRKTLMETGLSLTAVMENLNALATGEAHRRNLDRLRAAAELGNALSPRQSPIVETILGGKPDQWEMVKEAMATALGDWARVGEKTQTIVAVKPHVAGAVHRPEQAVWLVEKVNSPWVRLTYDFSHYRLRELTLEESFRTVQALTAFIHIKDAKGRPDAFQFLLPGEGDTDYVRYGRLLRENRYRGSVMVEVSGQISGRPGYDAVKAAESSYPAVARAWEAAGVRRQRRTESGR